MIMTIIMNYNSHNNDYCIYSKVFRGIHMPVECDSYLCYRIKKIENCNMSKEIRKVDFINIRKFQLLTEIHDQQLNDKKLDHI